MKRLDKTQILFIFSIMLIFLMRLYSAYFRQDVFCDEEDVVNQVISIINSGHSLEGKLLPLYVKVGSGLGTYTFIYPLVIFGAIFGTGYTKIRFFIQFVTLISAHLLGKGAEKWNGKRKPII